jgi:hypothetical protein
MSVSSSLRKQAAIFWQDRLEPSESHELNQNDRSMERKLSMFLIFFEKIGNHA